MLDQFTVEAAQPKLSLGGTSLNEVTPEPVSYPLVSFIVRNWNYARFVGAAISSVRNQTYPNLEAIVVDNGSTDDSRARILDAIGDDPRFRTLWLDENLGGLGGILRGLDLAHGEFVVFVDSDDYLFANYAAMHVQAHLALPLNVAFTSSDVIEVDGDGSIIGSGRLVRPGAEQRIGLRREAAAPRLSEVDGAAYLELDRAMAVHSASEGGWKWAPGTANMFRKFILDMARPSPQHENVGLAADGHFCRLAHVLGGSATIALPLSAYRLHGENFFAAHVAVEGLLDVTRPAEKHFALRRREAMRVLVEHADTLGNRMGHQRFWSAIVQVMETNGASAWDDFNSAETQAVMAENLPRLFATFGRWQTLRRLRAMMSFQAFNSVLHAAGGDPVERSWTPQRLRLEYAAYRSRRRTSRARRRGAKS